MESSVELVESVWLILLGLVVPFNGFGGISSDDAIGLFRTIVVSVILLGLVVPFNGFGGISSNDATDLFRTIVVSVILLGSVVPFNGFGASPQMTLQMYLRRCDRLRTVGGSICDTPW